MLLIPAFETRVGNAWILRLAMLFLALPPLLMTGFTKGDLKKRLLEIPTNAPSSENEKKVKFLSMDRDTEARGNR